MGELDQRVALVELADLGRREAVLLALVDAHLPAVAGRVAVGAVVGVGVALLELLAEQVRSVFGVLGARAGGDDAGRDVGEHRRAGVVREVR